MSNPFMFTYCMDWPYDRLGDFIPKGKFVNM